VDNNLDFSVLTDDQLLSLIRAALAEAVERGAAITAAAQSVYLDAAEKMEIARQAAEREAAILRAKERERIAREAAERVRQQAEAEKTRAQKEAEAARQQKQAEAARSRQEEAQKAAAETLRKAEEQERAQKNWLRRAATLLELHPSKLTIVCLRDNYLLRKSMKTRVLINHGGDAQYSRHHLVDYSEELQKIKVTRELESLRHELIALCAELTAEGDWVAMLGSNFTWEDQPCQTS